MARVKPDRAAAPAQPWRLRSLTLSALPLLNHFLDRLQLDALLARYLPQRDRRLRLPPATALALLLRNILIGRAPVYALEEWAAPFDPALLHLTQAQMSVLNDDRVGRALDHLFDADRASLLTEVVVRAVQEFRVNLDELHNDSTSVTFSGEYRDAARGRLRRGQRTLVITHGHNKDHRPDLKQLLWMLTVSADGAVPVHYRAADGNTTDDQTHCHTWDTLHQLLGRADFLYVADSKLCTREALTYIAAQGGRFLTVLPRTRREDRWFRDWLQTHTPAWQEVRRAPHPRRHHGRPDIYRLTDSPIRSAEGYRILWVYGSLKAEQDHTARQGRIEKGIFALEALETRLRAPRCRFRTGAAVAQSAEAALSITGAERWIAFTVEQQRQDSYRQTQRGRPGPHTHYVRRERQRFHLTWSPRTDAIDYDARSDGMFPLLTNCDHLSGAELLAKYKYQPQLEKRHEQLKTVHAVAPVMLKSVARIEALLFVYFLALLLDALIERELRHAMRTAGIDSLPLYPETRLCRAPTTDRLIDLFADLQRHHLLAGHRCVQVFHPQLNALQTQVLDLLGVPHSAYAVSR